MHLKLIQAIRANGQQHRPPAVVDTKAIGVSDIEAEVLVRSGVASIVEPEHDAEAIGVSDIEAEVLVRSGVASIVEPEHDAEAIGVSDIEAEVLVRSGVASIVEPEHDAEAAPQPAKTTAKKR